MTEQEVNNLIDSKIGKTKMSQLPEATQTSGLYSIGYNGNQSVKYKANLLQGDPLTVRKTYQTEVEALADKNPIDTTTSLPLKVGQFVSIVDDGEKNGIYRIGSIGGDGTMSLELQGKLGDLSDYTKTGGSTKTTKEVEDEIAEELLKLPSKVGYDISMILGGGYLREDGIVKAEPGYDVSDFIPVIPGDKVIYTGTSGASTYAMIGYNSGKSDAVVILGVNTTYLEEIVTIPDGVYYIKISGRNLTVPDNTRIASGVLFANFVTRQAYLDNIFNGINNKFKLDFVFAATGYLNSSGGTTSDSTYSNTDYIAVKEGDEIIYNGQTGASTYGAFGYSEKVIINPVALIGVAQNLRNHKIVIPAGVNFIRLSGRNSTFAEGQYSVNAHYYLEHAANQGDVVESAERIAILENALLNLVPSDSRMDENTPVTDNSAGVFETSGVQYGHLEKTDEGVAMLPVDGLESNFNLFAYTLPLVAGEKYVFSFYARSLSETPERFSYAMGTSIGGSAESYVSVVLTKEWKKYSSELIMGTDYANRVGFFITAARAQIVEIKDVEISKPDSINARLDVLESKGFVNNMLNGLNASFMGDSISSGNNAREWTVMDIDVGNSLDGYPTYYDIGKTIGDVTVISDMVGTLVNFTNIKAEDVGKYLGQTSSNAATTDRWWQVLCELTGMNQLQNVSMSSISVTSHEDNVATLKGFHLWHPSQIRKLKTRNPQGLHIIPDVVVIYRGTNDMTHSPYAKITDFGASSKSIPSTDALDSGGYGFKEGYCIAIQKIREAYPNVKIFLCTMNLFKRGNFAEFPTDNGTNTLPEYNNAIREVADYMGCGVIEFDKSGVNWYNLTDFAPDQTHPNTAGHAVLGRKGSIDLQSQFNNLL